MTRRDEKYGIERRLDIAMKKVRKEYESRCDGCGGEDCICCDAYHERQGEIPIEALMMEWI